MGMFFLTPAQQAAKDAEEARQAAELRAIQEAARSNISYAPTEIRTSDVGAYKTSEQLAAEVAEQEAKQKQATEQVIAEQGDIYASTVGTGGSFAERQEERAEREESYFNEQRTGMGSQDYLGHSVFTADPLDLIDDSLKPTSYFDEDNQAKGDPRLYDEIKEDFISGETAGPQEINIYIGEQEQYKNLIYDFDYGEAYSGLNPTEQRLARADGTIDYSRPANFQDAKDRADSYYVQSLERSLENATTGEEKESIQKLIDNGSPDFDTLEDLQNYDDLYANHRFESENGFDLKHEEYKALALQEAVMGDYMIGYQREDVGNNAARFFVDNYAAGYDFKSFKRGDVYFNTGTAFNRLPASNLIEEEGTLGQVGGWSYIEPEVEKPTFFEASFPIVLDVLSIIYPPMAPMAQATKTSYQGGDFEDIIESAGTTYVGNKVSNLASDKILDAYEALNIPVKELSEIQQGVIVDTTIDGLEGKSIQDSFEKNAGKALVKEGAEAVKDIITDIDFEIGGEFEIPEWVEKAGDVIVATGTAIGNAVEPIVKPVYEGVKAVGDVVEPVAKDIVDAGQQAVDVAQEAVQPISDFTSDVEDDILDAGRAFDDTVIDPIDDVVDTFGSEVVDPALQAGSDVLSDAEDVVSDVLSEGEDILKEGGRRLDDLINWEGLVKGMLAGGLGGASGGQRAQFMPTETEGLFGKELFKLKTKIEDPDSAFNPTTKLRKYG